jgi:hypothetical protein
MDGIFVPKRSAMSDRQRRIRHRVMRQSAPDTQPTCWLTREQAAMMLGVSQRTVDRYRERGVLGYFRGPMPEFDAAMRIWRPDVEVLS